MNNSILKQSFIHNYYSPQKEPLKMDAKPSSLKISIKRKRCKSVRRKSKKKVESITKELVDDVEVVSISSSESVNQQEVLNEDCIESERISPKIVFETQDKVVAIKAWQITELSDTDIIDSCKSVSQETHSNVKNKISEDIKITKSPKQETDLKGKSRVSEVDSMINVERVSKESSLRSEEFNEGCAQWNVLGQINNLSENIGRESINETDSQDNFETDSNETKISLFLSHIVEIINYVICDNYDLLFKEDKILLEKFCAMSDKYKFFCCKLFTHQVKWYEFKGFAEKIRLSIRPTELQQMYTFFKDSSFILTGIVYFSSLLQLNISIFP